MALEAEDVRRFAEATERVHQMQERLGMTPVNGMNSAVITVDAGGVGVWLACAAAVVCFLVSIGLGFMYVDMRREQQRTQDHISVIYQLIPDLRKMVDDELNKPHKQH